MRAWKLVEPLGSKVGGDSAASIQIKKHTSASMEQLPFLESALKSSLPRSRREHGRRSFTQHCLEEQTFRNNFNVQQVENDSIKEGQCLAFPCPLQQLKWVRKPWWSLRGHFQDMMVSEKSKSERYMQCGLICVHNTPTLN